MKEQVSRLAKSAVIQYVTVSRLILAKRVKHCERVSVSQLGGSGGMLPRENLKLKSSEMARNGS